MNESSEQSGPGQNRSGRVRYLIGSKDRALNAQLAELLSADAEAVVLRKLGDQTAPDLLVVETSPEHAEALRERLGPEVTIERDQPLSAFERGREIRHFQEGESR
ncbi:hypothetical protein [Nonomuraea dietziae]|uniref:hypothetical protein n=1 Tax=Nonomuraea dietziae TaxID=65515 RepID=UPI00340693F8